MRPLLIMVVVAACGSAAAQYSRRDDPGLRKMMLPIVKAATDCIARETLNETGAVQAYSASGSVMASLPNAMRRCSRELATMIGQHDYYYGPGTGQDFYEGAYKADVERAVLVRIRPELERRRVEVDRIEAYRRAEEERRLTEQRREQERRDADRKIELARLETERLAEQDRQERLKRERLAEAGKTRDLVRDHMYECTTGQLAKLVRSREAAGVLAKAAMTLCQTEVTALLDTAVDYARVERIPSVLTVADDLAIRERGREAILDSVTASAVQAIAITASSD